MPVYPSGGTIAQSAGSPGFGPAPAPVFNASASVRLNPADTAYFSYVPTLQGSRTTWTWSGWVKRSVLGNTYQELFGTPNGASDSTFLSLTFGSNGIADTLGFQIWNSTYRTTTQVFRDPAQWYHILLALDTTLSTAADRVKLYVNGTQITAFSTSNNPAQFAQLSVNVAGSIHAIGRDLQQSINFGGYLADINFVDGLALTPSSFTATDANTGQLVPAQYTGNRGTNGFYLPFSGAALAVDLGQNPKTTAQDFPYWPYNTLLVDTTSTNGAQNNTFLDSSTNNFTITRNGNTTQGNFTPFTFGGGTTQADGYYSGYFDGTGDFISIPSSAQLNLSGDFTIEMFFLLNNSTSGATQGLIANGAGSFVGTAAAFIFGHVQNPTKLSFFVQNISATPPLLVSSTAPVSGQWYHVAITRSGSTIRLFVNGQQEASYSSSATISLDATLTKLGAYWGGDLNGYISNARVVKGTAVYTANFTVPTTPLTNITNTSLLTCQSSQFIDNSTNAFVVTANGNAQPLPTNPFGMTAWSGYFDGTGDYLTVANNAALDPNTGSFCMECWVYITGTTGNNQGFNGKGVAGTSGYSFYITNALVLSFIWNGTGGATITGGTLSLNTWNHVAVVRNSGVIRLYLNGVGAASSTVCTTDINSTNGLFIGQARGGNPILGNMSNYRMTKGTLPPGYDATATTLPVPTAPLTAISGTSLLTCQSSTFIDNSTNAFTITVNGNPYTLTLNNPFNNPINYTTRPVQAWSTYFDGSGDYISSPSGTPVYNLGTGLWTWEAWINTNSTSTIQTVWFYYCTNTDVIAITVNGSTGVVSYNVRATNRTDTTTSSPSGSIRLNQWHHLALVRDSSTNITCYIDGKAVGVIALASNASFQDPTMFTGNPTIGAKTNTVTNYFSGYISNVRFVRNSAVYTGNFTPPTSPLTAVPNTMTLACQSNRVLDNSILNVAQVGNADTSISPVSPFIPSQSWSAASYGGTMYFDGTGDSLTIPGNSAFDFGTGNFTAEAWVYPMGTSSDMCIIDFWIGGGGSYVVGQWQLVLYTNNTLSFVWASGSNTAVRITSPSNTLPKNTWTHIAVTRTGNLFQIFTNGIFAASTTLTQVMGTTSSGRIGIQTVNNAAPFNGYISNARILKGTSLYTGPFVPPVLPFTNISNTSLLLNATNAGIYDATGQNVIETVGNAQVSTAVKKFGESSVSFDGSGDILLIPATERLVFGTADFTVEAWVYPTATQTQYATMVSNVNNPNGWYLFFSTGNLVQFSNYATVAITSSSALSNNVWTHVAVSRVGTTIRMFFNGVQVASATNSTTYGVATALNYVGSNGLTNYFLGYLQDVRVSKVGRYSGAFTPPAAAFAYNQYDIGNQQWLPNNLSVTSGINQDNLVDSPSDYGTDTGLGGQVRGNYATLNPLDNGGLALSNGNLDANRNSTSWLSVRATIQGITSGKWYWECTTPTSISAANYPLVGVAWNSQSLATFVGADAFGYGCSFFSGQKFNNNVNTNYGTAFATNDIMGVAFDADNGKIWFSKNGTWFASGDPVAGTNAAFTGITGQIYAPTFSVYGSNSTVVVNFGQRAFSYTAPTGFKCLVSGNITTVNGIGATSSTRADDYFNPVLYTGTGASLGVTGVGFQPDLVWVKGRSGATNHGWYDAVRGVQKQLESNTTTAETTQTTGLTAFGSDGFTVGSLAQLNTSAATYVAWNWKANGAGVANTDGTIPSTVSANTTSGCSIVTYTGNGTTGATVGHGLGAIPGFIITKKRGATTGNWQCWHNTFSGTQYITLNATNPITTLSSVYNATPTSTVIQYGNDSDVNTNGSTYVAYCFAPISGFSAMGSYTGTGTTDGPMIYTGFRPAYVLIKRSSAIESWCLMDSKREGYNVDNDPLFPNLTNVEGTQDFLDLLSNGFKLRSTDTGVNGSGTYIYIAFAEFPFKYSRAR